MSSRLQLTVLFSKRVTPVFSVAYALLLRFFAHRCNSSRFLSIVCALFAENAWVAPLRAHCQRFPKFFKSFVFIFIQIAFPASPLF